MKDIKVSDLEVIKKPNKFVPQFLWMKESDIHKIKYYDGYIYWYDKEWNEVYLENSDWFWKKREGEDTIVFRNWKYYLNWEEAILINK